MDEHHLAERHLTVQHHLAAVKEDGAAGKRREDTGLAAESGGDLLRVQRVPHKAGRKTVEIKDFSSLSGICLDDFHTVKLLGDQTIQAGVRMAELLVEFLDDGTALAVHPRVDRRDGDGHERHLRGVGQEDDAATDDHGDTVGGAREETHHFGLDG